MVMACRELERERERENVSKEERMFRKETETAAGTEYVCTYSRKLTKAKRDSDTQRERLRENRGRERESRERLRE